MRWLIYLSAFFHVWVVSPWSRLVKGPIEWVPLLVIIGQRVERLKKFARGVSQKKPTTRANAALVDAVHARARHQVAHQDVKDRYRHISPLARHVYVVQRAHVAREPARGVGGAPNPPIELAPWRECVRCREGAHAREREGGD